METLDSIGIKLCVGCTERTVVVSFVILLFIFCCVVSVHALQIVFSNSLCDSNAKCETFQRGQIVGACLAGAFATKTPTLLVVSRPAVSKVMMTYTNHGKTSSAKRNSGQKPKLSERDCHTLKRTVSINHRSTAA
jgi:hypothetical protein